MLQHPGGMLCCGRDAVPRDKAAVPWGGVFMSQLDAITTCSFAQRKVENRRRYRRRRWGVRSVGVCARTLPGSTN